MADFQKVVPLVVKKHLLYDGKFLGTFWPLVYSLNMYDSGFEASNIDKFLDIFIQT